MVVGCKGNCRRGRGQSEADLPTEGCSPAPRHGGSQRGVAVKLIFYYYADHYIDLDDPKGKAAKRTCQQEVAHLHLDIEIRGAKWQWDFQKLIFYYYADHYINFKDLMTELYPQPPSGIGPGAVVATSENNNNSPYTMAYGQDPDTYGAVPPYRFGYDFRM
ncbi:hypothetical protein LTR37_001555 [Vermiconidia calcicola]|uniref:Uncharacterized protein n=1 Tax=Vermiconidia calcicola TaxID=1690605 RepID=A0ACC3NV28_9PEZI|nr:hypothetical protein LTR37_001555 [Vermiconidia calcicola]